MQYNHILEINAKEWLDKVNGNSYFSAVAVLDDVVVAVLPFQYGYGDHYIDMAFADMQASGALTNDHNLCGHARIVGRYCEENKIKLITNKQEGCLKRDLARAA